MEFTNGCTSGQHACTADTALAGSDECNVSAVDSAVCTETKARAVAVRMVDGAPATGLEPIDTLEGLAPEDVEALFKERAITLLAGRPVPPFVAGDMPLARSAAELAKCRELAEHAEHKESLRARDREARARGERPPREKRQGGARPKPSKKRIGRPQRAFRRH